MVGSVAIPEVRLSDEQSAVVDQLLRFPKQVQSLGGFAGTGKSTIVRELQRRLPDFAVCAYTGKAANNLRRRGVESARTIHSLIYAVHESRTPTGVVNQCSTCSGSGRQASDYGESICEQCGGAGKVDEETVRLHWEPRTKDELGETIGGFLVDEASMVGRRINDDLLSYGLPVIYVGDHGQLPPVADDAMDLMQNPDYRLEKIHRNAGLIARFADHLRRGEPAESWIFKSYPGEKGTVQVVKYDDLDHVEVVPDQLICAYNKTRVQMNRACRARLGLDPDRPVAGDRVMCLKNDRNRGLFNGMQGRILSVNPSRNSMLFETEGMPGTILSQWVDYLPEQFDSEKRLDLDYGDRMPFDYAYCVTCHKAQGDEWGRVMVFEQRCRLWDHDRWAYTAASRAKDQLVWVTGR